MTKSLNWIRVFCLSFLLPAAFNVHADGKYSFGGRLFLDGGIFIASPVCFNSGVSIPDLRITGKADFGNGWYTKLDLGFASDKVKLKDAFLQKTIDEHILRIGYMIGIFSLDQSASTNDYLFMTGANVAEIFYPGRRMGVSYTWSKLKYYASGGVFCGDGLNFHNHVEQGVNATLRLVYRPLDNAHTLFHIGIGALYKRPDKNAETGERNISFTGAGCTYLSVPYVFDSTINNTQCQYQWNIESIWYHHKFFLQGELMGMVVKRDDHPDYHAYGGYVEGGYFILGNRLGYDRRDAVPLCAEEEGSLAVFARINHTNLNDSYLKCGMLTDISVGVNYYLNSHLIFRLNYSHVRTDRYAAIRKANYNVLQSRIQIKF